MPYHERYKDDPLYPQYPRLSIDYPEACFLLYRGCLCLHATHQEEREPGVLNYAWLGKDVSIHRMKEHAQADANLYGRPVTLYRWAEKRCFKPKIYLPEEEE